MAYQCRQRGRPRIKKTKHPGWQSMMWTYLEYYVSYGCHILKRTELEKVGGKVNQNDPYKESLQYLGLYGLEKKR